MKKITLLTLFLVAAIFMSSCQATGIGGVKTSETAAPGAGEGEPPVDSSSVGYPLIRGSASSLYPWYVSGAELVWEHATALILNGEISSVTQTHDLKVTLTLKDGRTLMTTEPEIDAVFQVIQTCGDPCASIQRATE